MKKETSRITGILHAIYFDFLLKILFFILFIAFLIFQNTQHISDRIFWLDEVSTFQLAILPFWEIPKAAAASSGHLQPPLFYWLGHVVSLVNTDPIILRSVSVACYIFMIGFVIFVMRELQIAARFILCFVLILAPFGKYATTEFRPYALSACAILVSSVLLYRLFKHPSSWLQALAYGLSALILQYSLTLNCFVFGIQVLFISFYIFNSFLTKRISKSLREKKPMVIICIILCIQYLVFLFIVKNSQGYTISGSFVEYTEHVVNNSQTLFNSLFIDSWIRYIVICLFFSGCVFGVLTNHWVTLYLFFILIGQLLFSTYMTYAAIPWFSQRYLVASYVAFSLICTFGAEALFRRLGTKKSIIFITLLLLNPMYNAADRFSQSLDEPAFNASTAVINRLRCENNKTIVIDDPQYISIIPWYAYRNDPLVVVPDMQENLAEVIAHASLQKQCFILQEYRQHKSYRGTYFDKLSALPGYTKKQYTSRRGRHVPGSAWLFIPK